MLKVDIDDAQTHLSKLAERARTGEEIIITRFCARCGTISLGQQARTNVDGVGAVAEVDGQGLYGHLFSTTGPGRK